MRKQNLTLGMAMIFLTSANAVEVNFSVFDSIPIELPTVEIISQSPDDKISSAVPVQSIDASKIRITGVTDISDALRRLPGISLHDYGGLGGSKTLTVRGLGSQHTGVIYDGSPLSDSRSGSIDLSRHSLSDLASISLSYGDIDDIFLPARSIASASTLIISTNEADIPLNEITASSQISPNSTKPYYVRARLSSGSFGFINPYVRVVADTKRCGRYSVSGEYIHSDNNYPFTLQNGSMKTRERRNHSEINTWHTEINARWKVGSGQITAKIYGYDNNRDLPGPVTYYVSKSDEHLKERNYFAQLHYKSRLSSLVSVSATGKFDWSSTKYRDIQDIYPGGRLDDRYYQKEYYATAALLLTPSSTWNYSYAVDWSTLTLTGNGVADQRPIRNSLLQTVAARYSQQHLTVSLRLLHSLYYNHVSSGDAPDNVSRLSPSACISVKPLDDADFYIRGSYKNIFRLPTFTELYYYHYGTVNLKPETTHQYNIGATYRFSPSYRFTDFSVTCDSYLNRVENKITAIPYNMFIWRMSNLGKVRVLGFDLTLSATITPREGQSIVFDAAYSFQKAQTRTNRNSDDWMKQLAYTPVNSGSGSLAWLNPWVNVSIHANATGSRYTTNQNIESTRLNPYCDAGLSVFRTFSIGITSFEVRFELMNIFDTQYEMIARYPMPGRSWRAGIDFRL